jgi:hypothetical protein
MEINKFSGIKYNKNIEKVYWTRLPKTSKEGKNSYRNRVKRRSNNKLK